MNAARLLKQVIRYTQYHILWPAVYASACKDPVDSKKVLFADSFAGSLTDNMEAVKVAMLSKDPDLKFAEVLAPSKSGNKIVKRVKAELKTLEFFREYATAGTLILTETYLPAYAVKRRKETQVIQLWHACGAFKKWGYSTLDSEFGASRKTAKKFPMHNCYTLVPVSSEACIGPYSEAFRCDPHIVQPLGTPRTDIFFDAEFVSGSREAICRWYEEQHTHAQHQKLEPIIRNKKIILYAPTFRGENISSAHFETPLDLEALHEKFGREYVFLYKLHPYAKDGFAVPESCKNFAFNITGSPADEALCAADVLITDYSSMIFEYSLLERPVILYAYDLDSYIKERNFYFPYKEFAPGPVAETQEQLISALEDISSSFNADKINEFKDKFMSACDGHSAERIADKIL